MALSLTSYISQIAAGQPRKPGPIANALQAIQSWASAGLVDGDIASDAAITLTKLANGTLGASIIATASSCVAYHNVNQTLSASQWETITLNSEDHDTSGYHSTSANTSRLTAPTTGKYIVVVRAEFGNNATGVRAVRVIKNGDTAVVLAMATVGNAGASNGTVVNLSQVVTLTANDYVEFQTFQSSGGSLTLAFSTTAPLSSTCFSIMRLGA